MGKFAWKAEYDLPSSRKIMESGAQRNWKKNSLWIFRYWIKQKDKKVFVKPGTSSTTNDAVTPLKQRSNIYRNRGDEVDARYRRRRRTNTQYAVCVCVCACVFLEYRLVQLLDEEILERALQSRQEMRERARIDTEREREGSFFMDSFF